MDKKKRSPLFYTILFAGLAVLLLFIDILSKWLCQALIKEEGKSVEVIKNFFYLTLSHNTKIAFSLGVDGVGGRILNISISLIMSVVIIIYYVVGRNSHKPFFKAILAMLGAGAIGNLIDRAFYWNKIVGFDGVIDMFQFYLGGGPGAKESVVNPFATFNFADACLVVGVILFIVYLIVDSLKTSKVKNEEIEKKMEEDKKARKCDDGKENN